MTPEESFRDPDEATNAGAPTGRWHTGWAAGEASACSVPDDSQSATFRALAWSEDDGSGEDLVPFTGGEHTEPEVTARPRFVTAPMILAIGATVAAVGIGGVAFSLTGTGSAPTKPPQTTQLAPAGAAVSPPQPTAGPPTAAPPTAVPSGAKAAPAAPKAPPAHSVPSGGGSGSPRVTTQQTATAAVPEAPQQAGPTQADPTQADAPPAPNPPAGPFPVPPAAPVAPAAPAAPAPNPPAGPFPVPPAAPVAPAAPPAPAAPNPNPAAGPYPVPPPVPPVLVVTPVVPDIITVAPPVPNFTP